MRLGEVTATQRRCFIAAMGLLQQTGSWPSVRQLSAALGLSSTNAVAELLTRLDRRGLIRRGRRARHERVTDTGWALWAEELSRQLETPVSAKAARVLTLLGEDCEADALRDAAAVVAQGSAGAGAAGS